MSYQIPKIFSFSSSIISVLLVGYYLLHEYYKSTYKNLTYNHKIYSSLVVYSELNLFLGLIYIILSCIWSGIILCCNDTDESICQFSIIKTTFLLSGVGTNIYLFYLLCINSSIVNYKMTVSGWILIGNLFSIILVTSINKLYFIIKHKKRNNYNSINF